MQLQAGECLEPCRPRLLNYFLQFRCQEPSSLYGNTQSHPTNLKKKTV